jgi:aminoglycoside 6'-N-acetyltransferase
VSGVILSGPRVTLRSATADDAGRLTSIRNEPEVLRWWSHLEPGEMEEFVRDERSLVIELEGEVIGAVQYGEEADPMYRHANIDVYVTAARHGQGFGSEAVRVLARHLLEDRGHHRITIDPAATNTAAIRAYAKVGFRPVGVMRRYEQGPDGAWHDGLLMELLAGELIEDPPPAESPRFESIFPILSTPDLPRMLTFYEGLLGGEIRYRFPAEGPPAFVTVRIGSDEIGIAASDEGPEEGSTERASLWAYVDDCDGAVGHLRSAAVTVVEEPSDQPWGERMARVLDPDGNEVIVGSRGTAGLDM